METYESILSEARARLEEAKLIASNPDASAEDKQKFVNLADDIRAMRERAASLAEITKAVDELQSQLSKKSMQPQATQPSGFASLGDWAKAVHGAAFNNRYDPRLELWHDPNEPDTPAGSKAGWVESETKGRKDLTESTGASGGFLVPLEQRNQLLQVMAPPSVVRQRSTVVPMRARQIQWPTLDQTGTTAGVPHWFGGILGYWTEEGGYKSESDAAFRQINLVAHKLATYTEVTDELLADSAISLEALLAQLFGGATDWFQEEAFINGTGAGQPLGIVQPACAATIAVGRAVAGQINLADVVNMLEAFHSSDGIWLCNRRGLSNLMLMNGPAGNPSYVFMPSARDAMPANLFGMPLFFNEHCPALGTRGDIILADWRYYLIADRQSLTVEPSKHYRFRYDITSWRGVSRVDGQPWLSQPLTWSDGVTATSPFVVLDSAIAT